MQIDRTTGLVKVRRQGVGGTFTSNGFQLTANSINDSAVADFNGDGRPDLAVVVDNALKVFMNDGIVSNNLEFTEFTLPNYAAAGISTVLHCAVGDMTGEGKPEIVISGTGDDGMGGTVTKVSWFLNNGQFQLDANNTITPSTTTSAGRIGVGDATGDGWADVIMADPDNTELVLFQNTGIGSLASDDHATTTLRPQRITIGFALGGLPAESLVVGDVTGDGRADAVVTMHFFGTTGATPNDDRDHQIWQLFEGRGAAPMFAFTPQRVGRAPSGTPHADFKSDVILQDLNGDRFPEIVLTSQFPDVEASMPAGIRAIRLNTPLNSQNFLTGLDFTQVGFATNGTNPHRLASGRYSGNSKRDILVANGGDPQIQWVFNNYTQLSKPLDGTVGVTTDSDPSGTADSFGVRSYYEYLDGSASFSLTFVNNTANNITGAFADCTFPANFSLNTDVTDVGWSFATISGIKNIRWPVDIPAGSSVVKTFRARIISGKANDLIKLSANLRQGTVVKALITVAAPFLKISGPNLTVIPNSAEQPWSFTYRPSYVPGNGLATIHTSPNGRDWTYLNTGLGVMTRITDPKPGSVPYFTFSSVVPVGTRYVRALLYSFNEGYKYSSVFNNFLPPTEGFKVSTKSPPKSGQTWTFSATQTTTAANATVRFQSTLTPDIEGSWTDLPAYTATVRKTNIWTFITNNVPSGNRSFRAISAAPGWVDSISLSIGPVNVTDSPLLLGEFSKFHADFVGPPVRNGDPATFIAIIPSVTGIRVRFQSKLASESDLYWKDLPHGAAAQVGTTWTLKTNYMPVGDRNFRAIATAPGYYEKTSIVRSWIVDDPLPQYPTIFGAPISMNGPVLKAGQDNQFKVIAVDSNGINRVYIESLVGTKFTRVGGPDMAAPAPGGFFYTTNLVFPGSGTYTLRAVVVDNYNPAQTLYSSEIKVLVGLGNGTTTPTIGNITWVRTQATAKTRGAIKISAPIGDDKQVYRAFLHRTNAEGGYISTVGEMVRAGTTNPVTFSFTHSNLTDSTYAYRIVAHDFDGNETISNTVPPISITTPAPEPSPIHLDIAVSSRFGPPTMPAASGNYTAMPTQTSGRINFTYSGLPAGGAQFFAYRVYDEKDSPTFWSTDFYYWTGSTTKTSGEFKDIVAPFWTNDKAKPLGG